MKKITGAILLLIFTFAFYSYVTINASNEISVLGATFEITENVTTTTLKNNVLYQKDLALSSSSNLSGGASGKDKQSINVLTVPTGENIRIINWSYANPSGWTKQTVTSMAKNFENVNPGWTVIAAVNGDFFDIDGIMDLPYQTNGYTVSNGEVYRPIKSGGSINAVGFTNDGTVNSLVSGLPEFTTHQLEIFDSSGNVIKTYNIDNLNRAPEGNQISVWYTYPSSSGKVTITTPVDNSFIVESPIRCLPMGASNIYGKGTITKTNEAIAMYQGQFAIQTSNPEVLAYLSVGSTIRVQQNLTGPFASCDNIIGTGVTLIKNSQPITNSDNMSNYRHPRTCIGKKADGSIVLFTVDGRQAVKDMNGMTYEELSAALTYYGCVEAYNIDGGGSTTMILRNSAGGFDVVNSPSDGNPRNDSNCILVAIPNLTLSVSDVTDTNVKLSYSNQITGVTFSNIKVTIDGVTKTMENNELVWNDLKKNTSYTISYSFDMIYRGTKSSLNGDAVSFKTGKTIPILSNYYYTEDDDDYIIYFNISDPDQVINYVSLSYGTKFRTFDDTSIDRLYLSKSLVSDETFTITLFFDIYAEPNSIFKSSYTVEKKQSTPNKNCVCSKDQDVGYLLSFVSALTIVVLAIRKKS